MIVTALMRTNLVLDEYQKLRKVYVTSALFAVLAEFIEKLVTGKLSVQI